MIQLKAAILSLLTGLTCFALSPITRAADGARKDAWTQIGRGILGPHVHQLHNVCGRIVQAAWRRDDSQNRRVFWMGTAFGGLWKSMVDASGTIQSYVPLTDNFPGPHGMGSFIVNRTNSDKILIGPGGFAGGTGDGRIYRTPDQGVSWHGHGLPVYFSKTFESLPTHINRIVEDRSDSTGNTVIACTSVGIYRSTDFGETWLRVYPSFIQYFFQNLGSVEVTDIVQDTGNPTIWYAGAAGGLGAPQGVIQRSTDGGQSWENYSPGTPVISGSIGRVSLAACEKDSNVLYALVSKEQGTTLDGALNGLYRSLDRGMSWHVIYGAGDKYSINPDDQALHTCAIACDPTDSRHIIFGLTKPLESFNATAKAEPITWRTIDSDNDDSVLDLGHHDYNFFLFRPGTENIVVANDGGYYIYDPDTMRVDDSGNLLGINATWLRADQGALASSYIAPQEFIAGLEDEGVVLGDATANTLALIKGGDGGQVSIMPGINFCVPFMPPIFTETTNGSADRLISYNAGMNWTDITLGLDDNKFSPMLIDPTPGHSTQIFAASSSFLWHRDVCDVVAPWQFASPFFVPGVATHLDHTTNAGRHDIIETVKGDQHLYIYTGKRSEIGGLLRFGRTPGSLAPLANGSTADARANADRSILQRDTIYYTTGRARPSRALFSTDAGKHWHDVTPNLPESAGDPDFNKLIGNPKNLGELFLATSKGVYIKRPNENWRAYSHGLRMDEDVQDIVINSDNANPATLYIATFGRGFWQRIVD